jgi:hypothetical protein
MMLSGSGTRGFAIAELKWPDDLQSERLLYERMLHDRNCGGIAVELSGLKAVKHIADVGGEVRFDRGIVSHAPPVAVTVR